MPVWAGQIHALIGAVYTAFAKNYLLMIFSGHIWICIAQGLSIHFNANTHKLRNVFVQHEGKETFTIQWQRDDFVKGSPDNPWPEVFDEFSEQIRQHIGAETHDLLTPEFTTTGPHEKAAAQVVLMDTLKDYFNSSLRTGLYY